MIRKYTITNFFTNVHIVDWKLISIAHLEVNWCLFDFNLSKQQYIADFSNVTLAVQLVVYLRTNCEKAHSIHYNIKN